MKQTSRKVQVRADHYTHQRLWTGAEVLRNLGNTSDGGMYARLAAVLFTYLAFEGALNYLGELLFPEEWQQERKLFSKAPLKGTLGKLAYVAQRCGASIHKGRRPYATAKRLSKLRSMLVHPRTEHQVRAATFTDHHMIPEHIEPSIYEFLTDGFIERSFADIKALVNDLADAARHSFPNETRHAHIAFSGAVGEQYWRE